MNRVIGIIGALLFALLALVPTVAAADPLYEDGRVVISVRGDITFPAGQRADSLVVIDGTATVQGDVSTVLVVNGTVNFVGSQADEIVAIASHVSLDPGSVVTGDVRVMSTTVSQAAGATVLGSVKEGLDWAPVALWIGPALFVAYLGLILVAVAAGLALAGLGARQVRKAEALISREPGATVLAGFAGILAIVGLAILAMVTIVGIPLGLVLLVGFLPLLAFVGYLVAGIWLGERILAQVRPESGADRPYLAAVVGILAVSAISFVPMAGGLISFVGLGAVILLMWRTLRGEAAPTEATVVPAASPAAG